MIHPASAISTQADERVVNPLGLFLAAEDQMQEVDAWACERPKSAGARSFSRPRPVRRATQEPQRSQELPRPGNTIEIRAGFDTFVFPTPSPSIGARRGTFQASTSPLQHYSPLIGIAIGSPTQMTRPATSGGRLAHTPRLPPPARSPPPVPTRIDHDHSSATPKPKKTKWRGLGSIFRKAPKSAVQPNSLRRQTKGENSDTSSPRPSAVVRPPTPLDALSTIQNSSPGPAPWHSSVILSTTTSHVQVFPSYGYPRTPYWPPTHSQIMQSPSSPASLIISARTSILEIGVQHEPIDSPAEARPALSSNVSPQAPMLELNLPNPTLDRYSVMFEKLLNPSSASKPSLLERRQSRLKSKFIEGEARTCLPDLEEVVSPSPSTASGGRNVSPSRSSKIPALSITVDNSNTESSIFDLMPKSTSSIRKLLSIKRTNSGQPQLLSPDTACFVRSALQPASATHSMTSFTFSDGSLTSAVSIMTPNIANASPAKTNWQRYGDQTMDTPTIKSSTIPSPEIRMLENYHRSTQSPAGHAGLFDKQAVQVLVAKLVSLSAGRNDAPQSPATPSKRKFRPRLVDVKREESQDATGFGVWREGVTA